MENQFSTSGYTMISNDVFDLMPQMGASGFAVYSAILRNTIGFQKIDVQRSLRTLAKQTGLGINTVRRAIDKLQKLGFIEVLRNGYHTLTFILHGFVRSMDRGFQYTKNFMTRVGLEIKARKTVKEADEAVSILDTLCIQNEHTPVSKMDTYKERKKYIKKDPSEKSFSGEQGHLAKEVASKIYRNMQKLGSRGYDETVEKSGGDLAYQTIKAFGGWRALLETNPAKSHFILKDLENAAMEALRMVA